MTNPEKPMQEQPPAEEKSAEKKSVFARAKPPDIAPGLPRVELPAVKQAVQKRDREAASKVSELIKRGEAKEASAFARAAGGERRDANAEQAIEAYLEESLKGETRIKEKMDPACEVSVVIPAYGEREMILRPLESLANQKGVNPDQFETIIVVNNPPKRPVKRAHETDADYARKIDLFNRAVNENQEVLKLLRSINDQEVGFDATDAEQKAIESIRASGMRVFAIDKASKGKTLPASEANVGGARNRGVAEAVGRFKELGRNGIVAQSDADVRFDDKYVRNLIRTFQDRPELIGLTGSMDFEEMDTGEIMRTYSLLEKSEQTYKRVIARFLESESGQSIPEASPAVFSGANMAGRAFETAIVGGVPKISGGEDPAYGNRLEEIGKIDHVSAVLTHPANRFSARTDVFAGHGQRRIKRAEKIDREGTQLVKSPDEALMLDQFKLRFSEALGKGQTSAEEMKALFRFGEHDLITDDEASKFAKAFAGKRTFLEASTSPDSYSAVVNLGKILDERMNQVVPEIPIQDAVAKLVDRITADPALLREYELALKETVERERTHVRRRQEFVDRLVGALHEGTLKEITAKSFMQLVEDNGLMDARELMALEHDPELIKRFVESISASGSKEELQRILHQRFQAELADPTEQPLEYLEMQLRSIERAQGKRHQIKS